MQIADSSELQFAIVEDAATDCQGMRECGIVNPMASIRDGVPPPIPGWRRALLNQAGRGGFIRVQLCARRQPSCLLTLVLHLMS
jgi:hypothetical protein